MVAEKRSNLASRVMVAAIGVPVGVLLTYLGSWPLGLTIAGIAALGVHEFFRIADRLDCPPFVRLGVLATVVLVLLSTAYPRWPTVAEGIAVSAMVLCLAAFAAAIWLRGIDGRPVRGTAATVFGLLYVGAPLTFAALIRHGWVPETQSWRGAAFLIFPLTVTWIGDTFAYFGGRFWGKKKLAPKVSPGKTIAGGVSGLVGSVLAGVGVGSLAFGAGSALAIPVWATAVIGLVLGVIGQIGDLAESVLKRAAGVKDSSTLIPGHGGILDRFDAVLFTLPATYGLLRICEWLL